MNISMKKITENATIVIYKFTMDVYEYTDYSKTTYKEHSAEGYCQYNKETEKFSLDSQKTAPYILRLNQAQPRYQGLCHEVLYVYVRLLDISRKKQEFPDTISIASCSSSSPLETI